MYPAVLTDDGKVIKVTPAPECACVFASAEAGPAGGDELTSARTSDAIDSIAYVRRLPARLELVPGQQVDLADYFRWYERLEAKQFRECGQDDAAGLLCAWADALERGGVEEPARLDHDASRAAERHASLAADLAELRHAAERRVRLNRGWRAESDLARLVPEWLERAVLLAEREGPGRPRAGDERFYLDAIAHGHMWLRDDRPLSSSLRERSARIVASRWLVAAAEGSPHASDPALERPLGLVEAITRLLA